MKKNRIKATWLLLLTIIVASLFSGCAEPGGGYSSNLQTQHVTLYARPGAPVRESDVVIGAHGSNENEGESVVITDGQVETPVSPAQKFSLEDIPPYSGSPYYVVNDDEPFFSDDERGQTDAFEYYSDLDYLERCGVTYANICKEIMPTEERGEIGMVKPSGWHTVKYNDLIDGNYLYNRCHLIGYQLAGENANEKNLITGTRYLNVKGMLPFENEVADYVESTGNHVLYRVTPIFDRENLVASGVLMEAFSVEDNGKLHFNVYCYNVQPGIGIDYLTGESWESGDTTGLYEDTSGNVGSTKNDSNQEELNLDCDYVANTNTYKVHRPNCASVKRMAEHNKWYYSGELQDLLDMGYKKCQNCMPR